MAASETTTAPKLSAADRKSLYTGQHSSDVVELAGVLHDAEESLAEAQRNLGRRISVAVVAWVNSGGTAEDIQKLILADIGGDYTWGYVSSWQRAAVVYDSLTPANQSLYGDSLESLKQLRRVPEDKRNVEGEKLAKNGKGASVRTLRDRADKLKPASKRKRSTTSGTETLVTKMSKLRSAVKTPTTLTWNASHQKFVTDIAIVAARAAKNGKALSKTETEAVAQLTYFGPVAADSK